MEIWKATNTIEAKIVEHIRIPFNKKRCLQLVISSLESNGKQTIKIRLSEVEYGTYYNYSGPFLSDGSRAILAWNENEIKSGGWYNSADYECDADDEFSEGQLSKLKAQCDAYLPTLFHYVVGKAIEIENKIS